MKILITIPVFVLAILLTSCSTQDISASKVPSVVLNMVEEKYPGKNEVEWKKAGKQFEAEVKINDSTDVTFLIDPAGKILKQKEDINHAAIPAVILKAVSSNYPDYRIDDVEKLSVGENNYYQFELERSGKKDVNVVFRPGGNIENEIKYWD